MSKGSDILLRHAKNEAPKKTGKLRKSLKARKSRAFTYQITEGVFYGVFVRKGTAPHDIFPVKKKALFWPGAAHPVKHVRHPGTRPNMYDLRAIRRSRQDIARLNNQFGRSVVKAYG